MTDNDTNDNVSFGIAISLMFNNRNRSFVIGAILIAPNGKRFLCRKHYESPFDECISMPIISKIGLRKFIWSINKDLKSVFGKDNGLKNVDYEKIYNSIETGRLNTILRMQVPIDDKEG